jgi:opacity protein-like surface antigen
MKAAVSNWRCAALLGALLAPATAHASDTPDAGPAAMAADSTAMSDSLGVDAIESPRLAGTTTPAPKPRAKLEALVPEVADHPWRLEAGPRPYRQRLSFSPAVGQLGDKRFFAARFTFNPQEWLGYEWSIGHNPGQSTHAVLHSISALVRRPFAGRLQPYASVGYGMVMVYPGPSVNAAPVTKNALTAGAGLEFFIRNDLALRADLRDATVFGKQRDRAGVVTYSYGQQTIGLAFFRTLKP